MRDPFRLTIAGAGTISAALPLVAALCLPLSGCVTTALLVNNAHHMTFERATTPRVQMRFRVLDAESRQPVPEATVIAVHNFDWIDDWAYTAQTGPDGIATLKLAKEYLHLLRVRVEAREHLGRDTIYFSPRVPRPPGVGALADDPIDLFLYKRPALVMGLRIPPNYRGIVTYRLGPTVHYDFPFPATFPVSPAGQRVAWTDVSPPQTVIITPSPRLGGNGWNGNPVEAAEQAGHPLPVPEPGAQCDAIAAWHIGGQSPDGNPDNSHHVLVIGTRADALQQAAVHYAESLDGKPTSLYNGWLRQLHPHLVPEKALPYSIAHKPMR